MHWPFIYVSTYYYIAFFFHLHAVNSKPQIKEISRLVIPGATIHWNAIGTELLSNDDVAKLVTITKDHPSDNTRCCKEMFKFWLNVDTQATWMKLLEALKSPAVCLNVLVDTIQKGTAFEK